MGCRKCRYYSTALTRCKLGKVNPRTKKNTNATAAFMGWSYICHKNKWKIQMITNPPVDADLTPTEGRL